MDGAIHTMQDDKKLKPYYKVTGDGTPRGTKVFYFDGDTEKEVSSMFIGVEFHHKAGEVPMLTLTTIHAEMDVIAIDGSRPELKANSGK